MSIDTYFCFCCLSTSDLSSLYSENIDKNYATRLQDILNITINPEDYESDSHICKDCIRSLNEIHKFKVRVFEIISILQSNGLIEVTKENEKVTIKKVTSENILETEEKYGNKQNSEDFVLFEDIGNLDKAKTIKQELEHRQDEKTDANEVTIDKDIIEKIEKQENSVTQYEVTADLKCIVCSTILPNLYTYHAHMNQHYPNHICESCGKGFLTEKRLKRHMPSHKSGPFKCQVCDAEFTNYNTLNSHRQRKHNSVLLYKCPHCDERFGTYARRAGHLADEHQMTTPKYTCKICSKKFLIAGNLSAHMRNKHFKVKRHVCPHCGTAFPQRQELAAHAATHTGQHKYHCDVCVKRYPRKKALIVHMRTHTNERRFACDVCGKRFIQKCTLLAHAKTHNRTEDKPNVIDHSETPITIQYAFVS